MRRHKRRRMGTRYARARRGRKMSRMSSYYPFFMLGGIILGVAAVVCVIIFVIVPLFSGSYNTPAATQTPARVITPVYSPTPSPRGRDDMSDVAVEAQIEHMSVNTPMIYGNEMVFTTGDATQLNPSLKELAIYNLDTGETSIVENIEVKYNDLMFSQMNDRWIVFLDLRSGGGGRICAYDRQQSLLIPIREYYYTTPKLSLDGDILTFLCQTSGITDKLYVCDLSVGDVVTLKTFRESPTAQSGAHASGGELIWTESATESNTGLFNCNIMRQPLAEGGLAIPFDVGMYVYSPMTNGSDIVYMDANRTEDCTLMLSLDGEQPFAISRNVLNYGIGDDFIAYTKDEQVYVYFFDDQSTGCLSAKGLKGMLASVSGDAVVWYDTTDGINERDIVKYAILSGE